MRRAPSPDRQPAACVLSLPALRLGVLLLVATAALAACAPPAGTPPVVTLPPATITVAPPSPDPTATPTVPPTVMGELRAPALPAVAEPGPCEHLLWPLQSGGAWTYELTTPTGTETLLLSAQVNERGAFLTVNGETQAIICGEGALAGIPPLPVAHPALGYGIDGSNPAGSLLPPPAVLLPLGRPAGWDQELAPSGVLSLPGEDGPQTVTILDGVLVMIHETNELATIATPAGDFLALPVDRDVLFDLVVQAQDGSQSSVIISASSRLYFAEGVGLVRVEYRGGMVSTPEAAWTLEPGLTLELVSYALPR